MPLWGDSPTSKKNRPQYVHPRSYQVGDQSNTYATRSGWVVKHQDGSEEILVAIEQLSSRLANANVVAFTYSSNTVANGSNQGGVWVVFDEQVRIIGANGATMNLGISGANAAAGLLLTATYNKGNGNNRLLFTFTAPNAANANVANGSTIFVPGGPASGIIVMGTNTTLKDRTDSGNNAYLSWANSVATNVGTIRITS